MSASRVRSFVEMESHPIPMQHWERNLNLDPHMQMQVQIENAASSASSLAAHTTRSKTGKRQRTDAGIANIGVRIQQAMRQAQAMRQTMHTASPQTQSPTPAPVSPIPPLAQSMSVEDMDCSNGCTTRERWVCDLCGTSMDQENSYSMGCTHEESSLRCVSNDC